MKKLFLFLILLFSFSIINAKGVQTKKYNYSKKAWEPITALTDDSKSLSEIYPDYYDKIPAGLTGVTTASSVIEWA